MAKVLMDRIQLQEDFDDLREKYSSALNSERRRNADEKAQAENSPFLHLWVFALFEWIPAFSE